MWCKFKDASGKWVFQGAFQYPSVSGKKKKRSNFLFVVFYNHSGLHCSSHQHTLFLLIKTPTSADCKSLHLWRDLRLELHTLKWKLLNSATFFFTKEWRPFSKHPLSRFLQSHLITHDVKWQCITTVFGSLGRFLLLATRVMRAGEG